MEDTLQYRLDKANERIKELEAVAESWMNDYQKLKDKYEPEILVTSKDTAVQSE